MTLNYDDIPTERLNPRAKNLDRMSVPDAVRLMEREDARMLAAVRRAGPEIARGVELIARRMAAGGRLYFFGAGTSGRLGVLEAAECPPTFDTAPNQIQAVMAGGRSSVFRSREGAEDEGEEAVAFIRRNVRKKDVVIGVAASGVTAFAKTAIESARRWGAATILVTCNPSAPKNSADVTIAVDTGPEVISGSTRLKAGTATKIILNRLTTLAMVRLGKTYGPYMVDLQPRSNKLTARAIRLIRLLGGVGEAEADALFRVAKGKVKTAILMARRKIDFPSAEARLKKAGGFLAKALGLLLLLMPFSLHAAPAVKTGLDVLEARDFAELKGKRVGVIINQTSVDARGRRLVDLLKKRKDVKLIAIFSPEHGYSGTEDSGRRVENGSTKEGIPIYSLYGATLRPAPAVMQGIDVLVFDLQDVGVRFYTYLSTMANALEAAKAADVEFMVLDRPNPLGGDVTEGEILDPAVRRFTGRFSVPVRHGMTAGEIARLHNKTVGHPRLVVVPMEGWRRTMRWKDTGLKFVGPSPNIRTPEQAMLYSGIGCFEATNVSVGRGTASPFHLFGAPWLDGNALATRLKALNLPGISIETARFKPAKDLYAGRECGGVRLTVTDAVAARPVEFFVRAAWILRDLSPKDFQPRWDEMPVVTGTNTFETLYKSGATDDDYLKKADEDSRRFLEERKPTLLYE